MTDCPRHALDETCLLCVPDTVFEAVMSYPTGKGFPLASADRECPTWLPTGEGVAA